MQAVEIDTGTGYIVNNGAAGMPNFAGDLRGLVTRIATYLLPTDLESLYGIRHRGVYIDSVPLAYDQPAWVKKFMYLCIE